MNINTDINILGGLTDWSLLEYFITPKDTGFILEEAHLSYSNIKTQKSVSRYERAVRGSLLHFNNQNIEDLVTSILHHERLSSDSLLMLFWNTSSNNELFHYLNINVFFPAFFSGKLLLKKEDVNACIKDLRESEEQIKNWSPETIDTVARKYLALLKSFNLLTATLSKKILHPYLNDKMFVLFVYWLKAQNNSTNILKSDWVKYSFSEQSIFVERVMQKKYKDYYNFTFTGDKLTIDTLHPYETIYHVIK